MKECIAIIQARMASSRLPGKVLLPLCGRPVLGHITDRLRASTYVNDVVVATSDNQSDDGIQIFCIDEGIQCIRGSESDVCKRFKDTINKYSARHYLRVCGDSPIQDVSIIDNVIREHIKSNADYTTNGFEETRTFPKGVDVRIARRELFLECYEERDSQLKLMENPLAYVHEHLKDYNVGIYRADSAMRRPELRFVADYAEDMKILNSVFEKLYRDNELFGCADAVRHVDYYPELKKLMNVVKGKLAMRMSKTSVDGSFKQLCEV